MLIFFRNVYLPKKVNRASLINQESKL